jgi:hypothetical protein
VDALSRSLGNVHKAMYMRAIHLTRRRIVMVFPSLRIICPQTKNRAQWYSFFSVDATEKK